MFTEEEVMALIEEAFESGYDSALEEVLDESSEDEYNTEYPELFSESSKNVRRQMDKLGREDEDYSRSLVGKGDLWREYVAKNPKRNWIKYADTYKKRADGNYEYTNGNINNKTYKIYNNDPRDDSKNQWNSVARGRIKSGAKASSDPRSVALKEKVAANAARRKAELKEKLRVFKDNRGNRYDD